MIDPELQKEMEELTKMTHGLSEATKDATKGLDAFKAATAKGAKDITGGLGSFAKSVGEGDTSFKSLNKIVDVASDALAGMAKTVPYAGQAVAAGIKAAAEAAKFMLAQMDQSAKAFNDLGQVGALGADGMTGIARQFTQSGLQLQSFTKLVSENSVALARFKGTAGEGAEIFSKAVGELTQGSDDSLRMLGMNADQIGATVGSFVTQQTRLGKSQAMDAKQLKDGALSYALELDKLSRVTGTSREALQKQQDASLSEDRFRANIDDLERQGKGHIVKELQSLDSRMSSYGKELGQGTRDLVSGTAANSDAAKKLLAATNGAAGDIIARVKSGEITSDEGERLLYDAVKANEEVLISNAKVVDSASSAYGNFSEKADFLARKQTNASAKAAADQAAAMSGKDALTKSTADAQKKIEKMSIGIQELGFQFLKDGKFAGATTAVTKSMTELVKMVNKAIGGEEATTAPGSKAGAGTPGVPAETAGGAATGGMKTGKRQAGTGPQPTPAGPGTKPAGGKSDEIVEILEVGAGYNVVKMGDGKTVKRTGARNWRDNNPGNLNYGELAKSYGALGADPRFAIFPSLEDGEKAREGLLFGPSYSGLTIAGAVSKYAPPSENDTAKYISEVLKATGAAATDVVGQLNASQRKSMLDSMARVEGFKTGTVAPVSAAEGAVLSGPQGGYQPNLTMHGTEAIVPIDTPAVSPPPPTGISGADMMAIQLKKLEELADVFKSQLAVDRKLLQYSS